MMKLINNTPYLSFFNPHISIFFNKNTERNIENTEKNHKKYKKTIKMRFLESEFLAKKIPGDAIQWAALPGLARLVFGQNSM